MTGVPKAVVCISLCGSSEFPISLSEWSFTMSEAISYKIFPSFLPSILMKKPKQEHDECVSIIY